MILLEFTDLSPGYPDVKACESRSMVQLDGLKKRKETNIVLCAVSFSFHQVKIISQALCLIYL